MIYNSNLFTYRASTRCFAAEASEMTGQGFELDYRNGKPGFDMQSALTGAVLRFEMVSIDRDREGDIQGWNFRAWNAAKRETLNALIIND